MSLKITTIAVFVATLGAGVAYGQDHYNYLFKTLTFREGLSHSSVTSLEQDTSGYLWLGTKNGLNRFSGHQVSTYKHVLNDSTSLPDNHVRKIFRDSQQRTWIVTESAVCRYRPERDDFITYSFERTSDHNEDIPLDITETASGQILVLSHYNVISGFSEEERRFVKRLQVGAEEAVQALCTYRGRWFVGGQQSLLEVDASTGHIIASHQLYDSLPLSAGIKQLQVIDDQLWMAGTKVGLHRFDPTHGVVAEAEGISHISSFASLSDEVLLLGTTHGIFLYDWATRRASSLQSVDHPSSLTDVVAVFVDRDSNLWVASEQEGAAYTAGQRVFRDLRHVDQALIPYATEISALHVTDNQYLWMGLRDGKAIAIDLESNQYQTIHSDQRQFLPGQGTVFSVSEDRQGHVWTGSYLGGLRQYQPDQARFTESNSAIDSLRIRGEDIRSIVEDRQGRLWLAVHGRGVDVYDPKRREVVASHGLSAGDTEPYISDWPFQLAMAPDGAVWVASPSGLQVINDTTKRYFQHNDSDAGSLSSDHVTCLAFDRRGTLWIGTDRGLNVLNPLDSTFMTYTTQQGLSDNHIASLVEDAQGRLWIGTYDGLSYLSYATSPQEATLQTVDLASGLYSNQFVDRASTTDTTGTLYFATTHGLLMFRPQDLTPPENNVRVLLTNVEVVSSSPEEAAAKRLTNPLGIRVIDSLRLEPDQNTISFGFSAVNFTHSGQLQYQYRLEGYDQQWIASTDARVTYHDLPPGAYQFKVKASLSNATHVSPSKSIPFTIRKSWHQTLAGRGAIALLLLALGIGGIYVLLERVRLKNQTRLSEKEREIDQLKLTFFMNLSHEFRTPLTLILGPLKNVLRLVDHYEAREHLHLIQRNAERLYRLVNQVLDVRQLEKQRYRLRVAELNPVDFVRDVYHSFRYLAQQQAIDYQWVDQARALNTGWLDTDVLDKILCNLLSNAFKYTPDGGQITVTVSEHATRRHWMTVVVADTGVGISAEQLDKVFERFYRAEATAHQGGTGIGLALCQELTRLHQGELTVASTPGQGSAFMLAIPTRAEAYPAEAFAEHEGVSAPSGGLRPLPSSSENNKVTEEVATLQGTHSGDDRPLILVADDNADLLLFIEAGLAPIFRVITARDGQEAFQKAVATVPDAVVSDVMMPVMDGLQLAKRLKEDLRTSHIPLVLLTARASESDQVIGLQEEVDDYVTKPFSTEVLVAKLRSLIANRARLRTLFAPAERSDVHQQVLQSPEKAFLSTLTETIDAHLDDEAFGTDDICQAVGMSRSQLYRKLSAVTGNSVHEFIKLYRLSRAAEMLCAEEYTVAEIATMTGFKYAQSFTRSFKGHYGCTPSQYVERRVQRA